jgi:hypothetical protein
MRIAECGMKMRAVNFGLVLGMLLIVGCAPRSSAIVPVSGTVTLDGQPLVGATLSFQPITDKAVAGQAGIGSYGKTDEQGRYTLRLIDPDQPGALVGKHTVNITTAVAANPASDEIKLKQPERISPKSRTQEIEIPAGGTDKADLKLSSR